MKSFNPLTTSSIIGLFAAALLPCAASAADVPAAYYSAYRFSGGERELQELRQELDRVASQFSGALRPIARQQLHDEAVDVHAVAPRALSC